MDDYGSSYFGYKYAFECMGDPSCVHIISF